MKKSMKYSVLQMAGLMVLLSSSACIDMTNIQNHYVGDRDLCHKKANGLIGSYFTEYSYEPSEEDEQKASNQIFCDCMKDAGWHPATCPKPQKPPAPPISNPYPNDPDYNYNYNYDNARTNNGSANKGQSNNGQGNNGYPPPGSSVPNE